MQSLRAGVSLVSRSVKNVCIRKGSHAARPELPPPSPIKNIGEYIEPKLLAREHNPATYRSPTYVSNTANRLATFFGTVAWTWILLGLYYEPHYIVGHFDWPDASKWTDKELGIPRTLELEPADEEIE